jgi:hypothetical protein
MTTTVHSRPGRRPAAEFTRATAADHAREPGIGVRYGGSADARVWLTGTVDTELLTTLAALLRVLLRTPARFVLLDLTEAELWDSALLRLVSRTQDRLTERAGMISLLGVNAIDTADAADAGSGAGTDETTLTECRAGVVSSGGVVGDGSDAEGAEVDVQVDAQQYQWPEEHGQ